MESSNALLLLNNLGKSFLLHIKCYSRIQNYGIWLDIFHMKKIYKTKFQIFLRSPKKCLILEGTLIGTYARHGDDGGGVKSEIPFGNKYLGCAQ